MLKADCWQRYPQRQVYPVFLEPGIFPQDCMYFLNREEESKFTSCVPVYSTGAICTEDLTNAQLELKSHTDTQASTRDILHR